MKHKRRGKLCLLAQQILLGLKRLVCEFFLREKDKRFSTFETLSIDGQIKGYMQEPALKFLEPCSNDIAYISNKHLKHDFDLLGLGWTNVDYVDKPFIAMGKSGALENVKEMVRKTNYIESKKILALLDSKYKLIDWRRDFKSNYTWSANTWYREIKVGPKVGVDIKGPWELARMHHLTQLALQYGLADKDEKYLCEFRNQVLDFIATNPPRYGVNWGCTMDVGIRVSNWLVAYDLFCAFGAEFDEAFLKVFKRSIYEHGKHIKNNLEWYPHLRSNHYLANIVGLLFVAAYLPSSKEIDKWFSFSIEELVKEVKIQFNSDGSNFEASTSYHRLSSEMVVYAVLLTLSMPNKEINFPDWFIERIQKMAEFTIDMTRPDGLVPQIGDNDSGRFLKLFPVYKQVNGEYYEELLDHRHLVAVISTLFDCDEFKGFAGAAVVESNLITPKRLFETKKTLDRNKYPDFGIYLLKSKRVYMAVRCGGIGQNGYGGHAHNDQLSFELCIDDIPFIVDPGTYVYTAFPKERNKFRATTNHSTLSVEGNEQNDMNEQQLFRLGNNANAEVVHVDAYQIDMRHHGYGSMHRRKITLNPINSVITINDNFDGKADVLVNFILAPEAVVTIVNQIAMVNIRGVKVKLHTSFGVWSCVNSWFSKGYGCKERTPKLQLMGDGTKFSCDFKIEVEDNLQLMR